MCEWLKNFGFWQTVAAFLQLGVAIFLYKVTKRYADLTAGLAQSAAQQSRLQQQAFKASLFEKRLKVFMTTLNFLGEFVQMLAVTQSSALALKGSTVEAEFLFEPEVGEFIEDIHRRAVEYQTLKTVAGGERDLDKRQSLLAQMKPLEDWLCESARPEAKRVFSPYLKFSAKDAEITS